MTLYVYLVVYPKSKSVPAHWAILVTTIKDGKSGQVYHAVGNPFQGYSVEVKDSYDLSRTLKKFSVVFLGCLDDGWNSQLTDIAYGIEAPGSSSTPLDPFAVSSYTHYENDVKTNIVVKGENCQNWAEKFIQCLIDRGALNASAMGTLSSAPKA
ncbi:hypothetical protein MaudMau93_004387 [Microsporum audouinii]